MRIAGEFDPSGSSDRSAEIISAWPQIMEISHSELTTGRILLDSSHQRATKIVTLRNHSKRTDQTCHQVRLLQLAGSRPSDVGRGNQALRPGSGIRGFILSFRTGAPELDVGPHEPDGARTPIAVDFLGISTIEDAYIIGESGHWITSSITVPGDLFARERPVTMQMELIGIEPLTSGIAVESASIEPYLEGRDQWLATLQ